jgi:hypothetical protein
MFNKENPKRQAASSPKDRYMTTPTETQETKPSDKELNFRALEARYQKQLDQERQARLEIERQYQEISAKKTITEEDDDTSDPYVDHKRLDKKLSSFEKKMEAKIDQKAEEKARNMMQKDRQESWLRQNPDFYDILQHADKFAEKDPELAETILQMPEGFERQKLVYRSIKTLGLHQPEVKQSSVQDKIDSNRKSPYYQPSGVGTAPYSTGGDFSQSGQKNAYAKMKELQSRLTS